MKQLQRALRRLGFEPGAISGNYGQGTAAAVTQWYTSKGYQAQQPSPDEQQELGQLEQSVSSAQETLLTMTGSKSTGGTRAASRPTRTPTPTATATATAAAAAAAAAARIRVRKPARARRRRSPATTRRSAGSS
ncbi:peptidoglycan-binding domain-containing protein [Streptomyces sp. M10(2022)]